MISKGRNVSEFFAQVVKNVASTNLEIRKLVYIYLLRYAESEPDLALLSINTFQKDLNDPNPLIRAMALRVLSGIRVPMIGSLVVLGIKKSAADPSPYVRKAAALSIPKCFRFGIFSVAHHPTDPCQSRPRSPTRSSVDHYVPTQGSLPSFRRRSGSCFQYRLSRTVRYVAPTLSTALSSPCRYRRLGTGPPFGNFREICKSDVVPTHGMTCSFSTALVRLNFSERTGRIARSRPRTITDLRGTVV